MDYEELKDVYINNLHKKLKEKINAGVYVTIWHDGLIVKITKNNNLWQYTHSNMSDVFLYGGTESIIKDIIAGYRRHILKLYFY